MCKEVAHVLAQHLKGRDQRLDDVETKDRSTNVGEDGGTQATAVVVDDLVCNIPVQNLALVPRHDGGNVILKDGGESCRIVDV